MQFKKATGQKNYIADQLNENKWAVQFDRIQKPTKSNNKTNYNSKIN